MAQFIASTSIELIKKCFFVIIYLVVLKFDNNLTYSHPRLFNGRISYYGNIPGPFGMPRDVDLEPIVQMAPDIGAPPGIIDPRSPNLHNLWVKQYVDNFNLDNTKTWKNLYLMNSEFYEGDGPIFLMIRGESPVSRGFMFAGAWTIYAQKYKAMLFQLEQRYYGSSYPTPDLSLDNMVYLTVEQTLADLANFIHAMNTKHKFLPTQKWIVFGGSYGGALAVWLRLLYPQLVYGVVSSSGPINLVVDFKKYLYAITKTLSAYPGCVSGIKSAYKKITSQIKTLDGRKKLRHELILCESFKHPSQSDIATLFYSLSGDFAYVVQYSGDNTNNNNVTIADTCNALSKQTKKPSLKGMKNFLKMSLEESNANCDGFQYKATIQMLKDTVIKSQDALSGNRQWLYQQCTQLGIFQTSDSKHQVFGHLFPLEYFYKQCTDVFGSNFVPITKITLPYSGLRPNTTNVLCVQGSLDPWRMLGLTKNLTAGVEAIFIQGTGHAADMYQPSPTDVPGLTEARILTSKFIGKLLAKAKKEDKLSNPTPINHPLHTISTTLTQTTSKSSAAPVKSSISNLLLSSSAINSASQTLTSISATSRSNSTSSQTLSSSISKNRPAHPKSHTATTTASMTAKLDREASVALRSQTSLSSEASSEKRKQSSKSSSTTSKSSEPWSKNDGKSSDYTRRFKLRSKINSLLAELYGKSSGSSFSVSSQNNVKNRLIPEPSNSDSSASYSPKRKHRNGRRSHITKLKPMVSTSRNSTAIIPSASKSHGKPSSSAQSSTADSSVNSKSSNDKMTKQPLENFAKSGNKTTVIKALQHGKNSSGKLSNKTSSAQSSTADSSVTSNSKQKHDKQPVDNLTKSVNETLVSPAALHTPSYKKSLKQKSSVIPSKAVLSDQSKHNETTINPMEHKTNSSKNSKPLEKTSSAQSSTAPYSVSSNITVSNHHPLENLSKSNNKTIIVEASQHKTNSSNSGKPSSSARSSTAVSSLNSKSSDQNNNYKPLANPSKSSNNTITEASLSMPSTSNISATIMIVPSKATTTTRNNSTSNASPSPGSSSPSSSSSSSPSSSSTSSSLTSKASSLASKTKRK